VYEWRSEGMSSDGTATATPAATHSTTTALTPSLPHSLTPSLPHYCTTALTPGGARAPPAAAAGGVASGRSARSSERPLLR
jgi:hypothetical protein